MRILARGTGCSERDASRLMAGGSQAAEESLTLPDELQEPRETPRGIDGLRPGAAALKGVRGERWRSIPSVPR